MKAGKKYVRQLLSICLLAVMLLEAFPLAMLPAVATGSDKSTVSQKSGSTEEDYHALYVTDGLVYAWDGFDITADFDGRAVSWYDGKTAIQFSTWAWTQSGSAADFQAYGTENGAYVVTGVTDFSALLPKHSDTASGLTVLDDMTFELVLSNQWESAGPRGHENYTGVIQIAPAGAGMLRSWNNQANEEEHPQDETYGPISMCMPGYYTPADPTNTGRNARFFDFGGWQSKKGNYFLGAPMGDVYSIAISHDFTMTDATTGTLNAAFYRDAAPAIDNSWGVDKSDLTARYDARYVGNMNLEKDGGWTGYKETANADNLVLKFGGGKNGVMSFGYHAIRMYDRALDEAELRQNHVADLFKFYGVDVSSFSRATKIKRAAVIEALAGYQIGKTDKAELEAIMNPLLQPSIADYHALYVQKGLTYAWDGFDMTADFQGNAVSWKDGKTSVQLASAYAWNNASNAAELRKTGIESGCFIANGVADFTSLLPKHTDAASELTVLDDMTFELVLSNQYEHTGAVLAHHENYTGTIQVAPAGAGLLHSWNSPDNATQRPLDETYGPISTTSPGFYTPIDTSSAGRNALFFDMPDWKSKSGNHFFGAPKGEVYAIAISHDFTMTDATTGTLLASYYRDARPAIDNSWGVEKSALTARYDARYVGNMNLDKDGGWTGIKETANEGNLVLKFGGGANGVMKFGFHAVRMYNRALSEAELRQNHAADLIKFYRVDLSLFDRLSESAKGYFYDAVRDIALGETTKENLEEILESFALTGGALGIIKPEDLMTYDGVQSRVYGKDAALRLRYTLNTDKISYLENVGEVLIAGVLYGERDRFASIDELSLSYNKKTGEFLPSSSAVIDRPVRENGTWTGFADAKTEQKGSASFGITLPIATLGDTDFESKASTEYYARAYVAACINGTDFVLYLDLDSESFGTSISYRRVADYLLCNGYAKHELITRGADEKILLAAKASEKLYLEGKEAHTELLSLLALMRGVEAGTAYYLRLYDEAGKNTTITMPQEAAMAKGTVLATARGYLSRFVKLGKNAYTSASGIDTSLKELLIARRAAAVNELKKMGMSTPEASALANTIVSSFASKAASALAEFSRFAELPAQLDAAKSTLELSTSEAKISKALNARSALYLDGSNISLYTIVTTEAYAEVSELLQRFVLITTGTFLPIYTVDNAYIGSEHEFDGAKAIYVGLTENRLSAKDRYSVYMKNGSLYVEGEGELLLEAGLSALMRTYFLGRGRIYVTEALIGESLLNEKPSSVFLSTLNLPEDYAKKTVTSYDVQGVLALFRERCAEKPDEVSVLPKYMPTDFALSGKAAYHVAVTGSDSTGDGSEAKPYATLQKAVDQLAYRGGGVVYVHGGTYVISDTVSLDARHSGTRTSPTIITAYGDGEVVFTTAISINGADFKPASSADFVSSAYRSRLNKFTSNNASKVYAVQLSNYGITAEHLAAYGGMTAPSVSVDGTAQILARYPNVGENNTSLGIKDGFILVTSSSSDIRRVGNVESGISSLHEAHKNDTGAWEIYFDSAAYKSRLLGYEKSELYYMYGSLYEEWDNRSWEFTLKTDGSKHYMQGTAPSYYGVKHTGDNDVYFLGMIEDLDAEGEYFVDTESGILYVYSATGLSGRTVYISTKTDGMVTAKGTENLVLSGIAFRRANGTAVTVTGATNTVIQDASFESLSGKAIELTNCTASGVTYSDFKDSGDVSFGYNHEGSVSFDRNFIQNNRFLGGARLTGGTQGYVISHNYFFETHITVGGLDGIIEYNEFDRGNQTVADNGPIYTANGSRGLHIRYNYLHDLNVSLYGIYLDDMASGSYVYGNVVHYASDANAGGKAVNLHNGAMNVVMNNICISTTGAAIVNNLNYYPKYIDGVSTGGGGLSYRWSYLLRMQLQWRFDEYNHAHMQAYDPLWYWHHLQIDEAVKMITSKPGWTNESKVTPDDNVDIFVRTPAMNVYMNNVTVDCAAAFSLPTAGLDTCIYEGNRDYKTIAEVGFVDAPNGNYALKSNSVIYKDIPNFQPIDFARIGTVSE